MNESLLQDVRKDLGSAEYAAQYAAIARQVHLDAETMILPWLEMALSSPAQPTQQQIDALGKTRVFFEALLLSQIEDSSDLVAANESLRSLCDDLDGSAEELSDEDATRFWELDGAFHKQICSSSGRSSFVQVVDKVIDLCGDLGKARTLPDARATIREHDAILNAVNSPRPLNIEKIVRVVEEHVTKSLVRWFMDEQLEPFDEAARDATTAHIRERMNGERFGDLERAILAVLDDASDRSPKGLSNAMLIDIVEDMILQYRYPDQFVVVVDRHDDGKRHFREAMFHSADSDEAFAFHETLAESERAMTHVTFQPALF
ncbi:MAG: FCD domain-containing protein [Pirellulaceae bacterium]|nr:FCD domain-containing protein [Pirellulaceae bacterium]MDP7015675.1 FCD domain-containing protein [Pirellulaceae bacterium]